MKRRRYSLLMVFFVLLMATTPIFAQDNTVVISLTVPEVMEDLFKDQIISQFEAENPGIRVHLVKTPGFGVPYGVEGTIEEQLDAVEEYASSADVVMVETSSLNSEITRTGYFLDLNPLVNSDSMLSSADFYPTVWQSFQWDGGMWALPVSVDATVLLYDPVAFDAAGLGYPNESWTIYDLEFTARTLAQFDAEDNTVMPGFVNFGGDLGSLFISMLGQGIYDPTSFPTVPYFDNPELENVLTIWNQMQIDGLTTIPSGQNFSPMNAPLQLSRTSFSGFRRGMGGGDQTELVGTLLPGGRGGLVVSGYAISGGTQYPQESYELLKFLSNSPAATNALLGATPARQMLDSSQSNQQDGSGGGGGPLIGGSILSPEMEAVLMYAIKNGIPGGEALFAEYLPDAINIMRQQGLDAGAALDEVELTILNNLSVADERRATVHITVAEAPSLEVASGEISINFGIASFMSPLPNRDVWDQMALDFAANDPEVGMVILDEAFSDDIEELAESYDCFYMDTNVVPSVDLSLLRSIDPLLSSDPTFSPNDIVGNVMQQVQMNNQTWAMPLMLQPAVMRYEPDIFAQAGAYSPDGTWTVDQFEDALRMLKLYLADGTIPYQPRSFDNSYLLMLIAAYGGLPLDYRTDPATINFTDQTTIDASREVLDLAKEGYFEYSELASHGGGVSFIIVSGEDGDVVPLYGQVLNSFSAAGGFSLAGRGRGGGSGGGGGSTAGSSGSEQTSYITSYPQSSQYVMASAQYTVVSYDLSAAYISANTQHTEACYRFISEIAQNPDFITLMPVRYSVINSPEILAAQGEDSIAFYNALADLLLQSNIVEVPTTQLSKGRAGIGQVVESYWINRAFDRYVLQDADLETELAEAQVFTLAYRECAADIPPFDPAEGNQRAYFTQFQDCATQVDPSADMFGG